jgi:hypothetical protein
MSVPRRVQINGEWREVRSGWSGGLDLYAYGSPISYTAREPYAHVNGLYFVYDSSGNKVGEFHIGNRSYSGYVTGFD